MTSNRGVWIALALALSLVAAATVTEKVASTAAAVVSTVSNVLASPPAGTDRIDQSESSAGSEEAGSLIVTPSRALFDVTLRPGESRSATATLRNDSAARIAVRMTATITKWFGPGEGPDYLRLSTVRSAECSAAGTANNTTPLNDALDLDQGTLNAGETATVCVNVALLETANYTTPTAAQVDFAFVAVQTSGDDNPENSTGDTELAQTGLALGGALLVGVGLLAVGVLILLRHKRRLTSPTLNGEIR